jgi:tagaturonate reductase
MKALNRTNHPIAHTHKIRVAQFGTGNFLRGFVDYAFHVLNKTCQTDIGIVALQSTTTGQGNLINAQEGLFTLITQGIVDSAPFESTDLVDTLQSAIIIKEDFNSFLTLAREPDLKFAISNTTEAGIEYLPSDYPKLTPPESFPAKLTLFLFERYRCFNGSRESGLVILPCELIAQNADKLKTIVVQHIADWNLGEDFKAWVCNANVFCNTLVDRIVSGYPKKQAQKWKQDLCYEDGLMVTAEPFFLWVIEANSELNTILPFDRTPLNVKIVSDLKPYHTRKTRILNGAHTAMVPVGILQEIQTVGACMDDVFTFNFIKDLLFREVIPILNLDQNELEYYAYQVLERFKNPFISHNLEGIALNSIAKFRTRLLPTLLEYHHKMQIFPPGITFAFAALLLFYKGDWKGAPLPVKDDAKVKDRINDIWKNNATASAITQILATEAFWNLDLSKDKELISRLSLAVHLIEEYGIRKGWEHFNTSLKAL